MCFGGLILVELSSTHLNLEWNYVVNKYIVRLNQSRLHIWKLFKISFIIISINNLTKWQYIYNRWF